MVHLELVVAKLVTVLLGVLIAVQAYRGYRRHGSWPMRYLAVGFLIISVGSVVEGVLYEEVGLDLVTAGAVQASIVALGMLVILYSLYAKGPVGGSG